MVVEQPRDRGTRSRPACRDPQAEPGTEVNRTLVTGGTRGIGAAIADRLAEAGHDLVLGYVNDDASAELAEAAVEAHGAACTLVRADLLTAEGVDALFAGSGPLTGVVNNAGATFHIGPLAETPVDVIRRTIDLNLTSAILVARAAVRAMGTTYGGAGGVLVNISSGAATGVRRASTCSTPPRRPAWTR